MSYMAINEWKIWEKLGFKKPEEQPKIDVDKDIDAILTSLEEVKPVIQKLITNLNKFKSVREQEKSKSKKAHKKITEKKVKIFDKILEQYEYYELDVDVNGERVKNISTVLGKEAKDSNISKKWLNKIKNSERWIFDW